MTTTQTIVIAPNGDKFVIVKVLAQTTHIKSLVDGSVASMPRKTVARWEVAK
jgi:hypothetical protein